jgi:signal transduction histidine kinase
VIADKEKIGWVLNQLLDNAIKFTPTGGSVVLEAYQDDGKINLSIQDNGIGIPPERITEIFEPFHQLDSSVTRRYSGTGLGLAMVRRILDAHGSQIKVSSTVDTGTRFDFSLPTQT